MLSTPQHQFLRIAVIRETERRGIDDVDGVDLVDLVGFAPTGFAESTERRPRSRDARPP